MRLKHNRHGTTKSTAQYSLMTLLREEDLTLCPTTPILLFGNPDTGIKTIRDPIDILVLAQIETETQIQINSITKTDQATFETTVQKTVNKLSRTSMLDQRTAILRTRKFSRTAANYLHPTQFNSSSSTDKM